MYYFPSQFSKDETLPFIASCDNQNPSLYAPRDFPITHFDLLIYLTYDTHSINQSLEIPPPIRPYYTYLPQTLTSDTTSDVSVQTVPSTSNVLVNAHTFGNQPPKLDTPPLPSSISIPPSNNHITTQPSSSHSPLQYNTPSNTPPPTNKCQSNNYSTNNFSNTPNSSSDSYFLPLCYTQPQYHSSITSLPQTLSTNSNHPFSLHVPQNLPQTSKYLLVLHLMTLMHHFIPVSIFSLFLLFNLLNFLLTLAHLLNHLLILSILSLLDILSVYKWLIPFLCCSLRHY